MENDCCLCVKKHFVPVAQCLSSQLAGSTLALTSMVSQFLARVSDSETMVTAPSQPAAQQLQSLLDTGKLGMAK